MRLLHLIYKIPTLINSSIHSLFLKFWRNKHKYAYWFHLHICSLETDIIVLLCVHFLTFRAGPLFAFLSDISLTIFPPFRISCIPALPSSTGLIQYCTIQSEDGKPAILSPPCLPKLKKKKKLYPFPHFLLPSLQLVKVSRLLLSVQGLFLYLYPKILVLPHQVHENHFRNLLPVYSLVISPQIHAANQTSHLVAYAF